MTAATRMTGTTAASAPDDAEHGHALTGTGTLVRVALRRDRIVLPVWLVVVSGLLVASIVSVTGLYGTEAERVAYATVASASAVARAFDGPMSGTSLGAVTMTEVFGVLAVLIGIMCSQAVVRHTRLEEESGRAELVGSAVVGRHARLTAAVIVLTGISLVTAAATTVTLLAHDLPVAGSMLAGLALAGVGVTFGSLTLVGAQVTASARTANGIGAAAVGIAFLLRAVGDAAGEVAASGVKVVSAWPSWLSPIGWGQQARAFEDERWWVLGLFVAASAAATAVAFVLSVHRDVGAGMHPPRSGPAVASRATATALGLAWRLQRGGLVMWSVGVAVIAAALGGIGEQAGELVATSDELAAALAALGSADALIDLYFGFVFGIVGLLAAAAMVQGLLRLRSEEAAGRLEPLLATACSRGRWLTSHAVCAIGGGGLVLVVAGLIAGFTDAAVAGSFDRFGSLVAAALVQFPAALVLAGVAIAATGLLPRWAAAVGWGAVGVAFVVGQLGALFGLPQAALNVSPFTHVPLVPAEPVVWLPLLLSLLVAAALAAVGTLALHHRDIRS